MFEIRSLKKKSDTDYVLKDISFVEDGDVDVSTFYYEDKGDTKPAVYIDTKEGKTVVTSALTIIPEDVTIEPYNYSFNFLSFIRYAFARVSKVNCNGEDAYQIKFLHDGGNFKIVSKDTGLVLVEKSGTETRDDKTIDVIKRYEFEFDNVDQGMVDIKNYIDVSEFKDSKNVVDDADEKPEVDDSSTTPNTNTISNTTNTVVQNTISDNSVTNNTVSNTVPSNRPDEGTNPEENDKEKYGESSFIAIVGKKYSSSMIVEGTDDNDSYYSRNEFTVSINDDVKIFQGSFSAKYDEIKVGDKVRIYYNNGVLETKPARIPGTSAIEILKK